MSELSMELRSTDQAARQIVGVVAPYDEVTYLVADPGGELLKRGCFAKSIAERGAAIPLFVGHGHKGPRLGRSTAWQETPDGLVGTFTVNAGPKGDEVLAEARDGYWPSLSVGFEPLDGHRDRQGVRLVTAARLHEVSLVGMGAYAGAQVLAVRSAETLDTLLAPFRNPPAVDLTPIPQVWLR